ncbi:hypothetical protein [Kutzneria sp. CA-103260]|uniref:hypothetical protein n=1 Tax=Kutzneria sp. CA-103260 TaxID=2802641 RepID=UPI001BAD78BC|nr:hypothetical protein [Kutzneria sp. CA-103260]
MSTEVTTSVLVRLLEKCPGRRIPEPPSAAVDNVVIPMPGSKLLHVSASGQRFTRLLSGGQPAVLGTGVAAALMTRRGGALRQRLRFGPLWTPVAGGR